MIKIESLINIPSCDPEAFQKPANPFTDESKKVIKSQIINAQNSPGNNNDSADQRYVRIRSMRRF